MADIEITFVGRMSTLLPGDPDCLIFATPDDSRILPVWVAGAIDMGGRPTAAVSLATVLASDALSDPWTAEISTVSRGQFTATLVQGERRVDIRPSMLEALWHAGVLFDVKLKESLVGALLDANPAWVAALRKRMKPQALADAADSSNDDVQFMIEWDPEAQKLDGVSPNAELEQLSDEAFDDELKKLLGK